MAAIRLSRAQRRVLEKLAYGGELFTTFPGDVWRDDLLQVVRKATARKFLRHHLITTRGATRDGILLVYESTGLGRDLVRQRRERGAK